MSRNLSAYYYEFEETGIPEIDDILEAVAYAGKMFHHTDGWNDEYREGEETCAEQIQRVARESAEKIKGRMTPSRAKEVLEGMGLEVFNAEFLRGYTNFYLLADKNGVAIDGLFDAEELQAIALWMTDPEGVTNAQTNTVEVVRDE